MIREYEKFDNEMVSVIMPAFNSEKYIEEAIRSVLMQTYTDLELIIYDDASEDATLSIVNYLIEEDSRIRIIKGEINAGVANSRNKALAEAKGRYIAFLDSDDLWKSEKIKKQMNFMKSRGCGLCYSSYEFINADGSQRRNGCARIKLAADYKSLLKNNFIGMLRVMLHRQKTGEIKFSSDKHEDLILWLSLAKKNHSLIGLDESLAFYRISGNSLSGNKIKAAVWRWKVYRNSENMSVLTSIWYIYNYILNSIVKRIGA